MTTIVPFNPTQIAPFQFSAQMDGASYTLVVTWNVYGKRWYISVYDQFNTRVLTLPLIGSPINYDIDLMAGYFSTPIVFRIGLQQFEVG